MGKIARLNDMASPKKLLAAWIIKPQKNGAPQLTYNCNFAKAINDILPQEQALSSSSTPLKEWLPIAKDEKNWQYYIDEYFESWWRLEESDDESEDKKDECTGSRPD